MNETSEEEELSQCPFSKREKKLFENNNEKISPVCLNILAVVTRAVKFTLLLFTLPKFTPYFVH